MKKLLLILILTVPLLSISQPIDLFQQFNGQYDFTAFGNTLNEFPNFGGYCDILPESSADLSLYQPKLFFLLICIGPGREVEILRLN